ncbi:MAG: hypothetical protein H0W81_00180 [Chloroflexi bacterium]|nr:hypothetical protein [Chloroflexota bacterium]
MKSAASVRFLLVLNAVFGLGAGVGLAVLPELFLSTLGLQTDQVGTAFARLYGAELIGFNIATWLTRNDWPPSTPIVRGHIANEGLTAVVAAAAGASGLGNLLVWGLAALAALFSLGYLTVALQRDGGGLAKG